MPTVTMKDAIQRVASGIPQFQGDDLIEIYNEFFPETPMSLDVPQVNRTDLLAAIMKHVQDGLEVEEIVDVWNVIFPEDRNVWYDEETNTVHFNEEPEHVESPE